MGRPLTLDTPPPAVLWDSRPDEGPGPAAFRAARGRGSAPGSAPAPAAPALATADAALQADPAMAAHAVATEAPTTAATAVQHEEGGWPEGVDGAADQDTAARFRRKLEAEPGFLAGLRAAAGCLEVALRAGRACPVFGDAFGCASAEEAAGWSACGEGRGVGGAPPPATPALVPAPQPLPSAVAPADADVEPGAPALIRIAGLRPPGPAARTPVSCMAWSPDGSAKLLISHAHLAYTPPTSAGTGGSGDPPAPAAFWWDASRPAAGPVASFSPPPAGGGGGHAPGISAVAPAPREAGVFVAGLTNGRLALYDPRTSSTLPVSVSPTSAATHGGAYVTALAWPSSKATHECVSAGADGLVRWWDARALGGGALDSLELVGPGPASQVSLGRGLSSLSAAAAAVPANPALLPLPATALLCPAAGTARVLVGTAGGVVLPVARVVRPPAPRVGTALATLSGPVAGLAPAHPALARVYVSAGEWAPKVWSEDARTHLVSPAEPQMGVSSPSSLRPRCTAARWSASRPAIVFGGGDDGVVRAYDLRARGGGGGGRGGGRDDDPPPPPWVAATRRPVVAGGVSCLAARGCGRLLAVGGDDDGVAVLVEVSAGLATPSHPGERGEVGAFLEREAARLRGAADRAARVAWAARGGGAGAGPAAAGAPASRTGPSPAELAEYQRRFLKEAGLA